jgi:hypothetical protein
MFKMMGRWLAVAVFSVVLVACSGTQTRGLFQGLVLGKTVAEVESTVGKADAAEQLAGGKLKWVYKKRTFDPDNQNQADELTNVLFEKDKSGNLVATDVSYN